VLLLGPPGSGKSELLLRLIDRGFVLVADDRVEIDGTKVRAPDALVGLIEVRGVGIVRLPHAASACLRLAVELVSAPGERLPEPCRQRLNALSTALPPIEVPRIAIVPSSASAPIKIEIALACALGRLNQVVGAFTP
jgi:HPr kinase/phosphorylase